MLLPACSVSLSINLISSRYVIIPVIINSIAHCESELLGAGMAWCLSCMPLSSLNEGVKPPDE